MEKTTTATTTNSRCGRARCIIDCAPDAVRLYAEWYLYVDRVQSAGHYARHVCTTRTRKTYRVISCSRRPTAMSGAVRWRPFPENSPRNPGLRIDRRRGRGRYVGNTAATLRPRRDPPRTAGVPTRASPTAAGFKAAPARVLVGGQ